MNKLHLVLALFVASTSAMPSPQISPIVHCNISQINVSPDGFMCCGPISVLGGQCIRKGGACPL
ncbi:hypothetical protein BD779DRAFT_1803457 [Infundibulicybe gibba]|nr:hypothetical protein BD779DRAFT_1803457 [Infundibulicybe gibba]